MHFHEIFTKFLKSVSRKKLDERQKIWYTIRMKNKRQKWIKPRHKILKAIVYPFFYAYAKRKYGLKIDRFEDTKNRPYLILMNHQTGYDQFFVDIAFKGNVYCVATEDIFSMGFASKLLRFFIAPIPIKKSTHDVGAVMNCLRVAKEGGSIAIFPEGNRTYSGKTEHISPSIAKLARMLKLPIAFMRLEGGYGVQPRWSDVVRKGTMRARVSRVMEADEIKTLSVDELHEIIVKELHVNENHSDEEFYSKKSAEYLERAMYVCPFCGISVFESKNDTIECKQCHRKIKYGANKELSGIDCSSPYRYIGDWYDYQSAFIANLELSTFGNEHVYKDEDVSLFNVVLYKKKQLLKKKIQMFAYNDRFTFTKGNYTLSLPFEEVSTVTVLGRNKLNIYYDDNQKVYQIKGTKRFNALKYVQLYYHYKNIKAGNANGKFLGL